MVKCGLRMSPAMNPVKLPSITVQTFAVSGKMRSIPVLLMVLSGFASAAEKADFVLVEKSGHRLSVFSQGKQIGSYHVVFGGNPVGTKEREGDGKTSEGRYILDRKNADSAYYKAFHVSYPAPQDIARARKAGVSPGQDIMIHGQKNGFGWLSSISRGSTGPRGVSH